MSYTSNDMHEFKVYVSNHTRKAMLCTLVEDLEDEDAKEFWLPLSEIEIVHIDEKKSYYTVKVPEWLATEKGIV